MEKKNTKKNTEKALIRTLTCTERRSYQWPSVLLSVAFSVIISVVFVFSCAISVWAGQLKFDNVPVDITTADNDDLVLAPGTGGKTQIGVGTGNDNYAKTQNDLFVTGILETSGATYLDAAATITGALTANGNVTLGDSTSDTITPNGIFSVTKSDATGDEVAYNLGATINKATSGNYTGLKLNVTETSAPGAANKLMDLQVAGVSKYSVANDGTVTSTGSQIVTGNITPSVDSTYNLGSTSAAWLNLYTDNIKTVSGTNLTILPTAGYTIIGDAGSPTYVSANDDLFVSGILEVAGATYLDGNTALGNASADSVTINASTLSLVNASTLDLANSSVTSLNIESGLLDLDTANSRVGIGTTAPGNKLEVIGSMGIGTIVNGYNNAAPSNGAIIEGSVGIGTTSPAYLLDVGGDIRATGNVYANNISPTGTSTFANLQVDGNTSLSVSSGSTGIGTTAPGSKLGVLGNLAVGATYGKIAAPTSGAIIEGNVGIGTTAPASKLDVEGGLAVGATYSGTSAAPTNGAIIEGNVGIGLTNPAATLDITSPATSGGVTTLVLNPGAHTAMTAEKNDFLVASHTDTITGAIANQRFSLFNTPTITAGSALAVTNADTVNIAGIPAAAGSATISGASALRIPVAPQASSNVGLVSLGSGPWDGATAGFFTGSSSGTLLAGNAASGFAGNLFDLQVAGIDKFKVDASGNVTAAGTIAGSGTINGSGTQNYITKFSNTYTLANSVLYESSGSIGIGTTAPGSTLGVLGAASIGATYGLIAAPTSGAIIEGKVGIGITNPGGTLSVLSTNVTGTITSSALNLAANSLTTGTGLYLASSTLTSGLLADLQVSGTAAIANQTALNILTTGANAANAITTYGAQISNTHTNATSGTNVGLYLNASGATSANYGLIVNSGSVGIGTTAPAYLLDVGGDIRATGNVYANNISPTGTSTFANLLVDGDTSLSVSSGSTGVGTTAPGSKLGVLGNLSVGATYGKIAAPTSGAIIEGNVGIGTTGPASKLDIEGGLAVGATYSGTSVAPTNGAIIEGSVGIGVTAPAATLDITSPATSGGTTTLAVNPGAHTAMIAEKNDLLVASHTDTITGAIANQRFSLFNTPTITAGSALAVTNADTVNIAGIPAAAGSATIAGASALRIPVAPQASANVGLVSLGSGPWDGATAGYFGSTASSNASGTILAANAASGYAGDLANLEVAGASKFKVDASGNVTYAGTTTVSGNIDMQNNIITNIGNAGTDFVATTGALNLAGTLTLAADANLTMLSGTGLYSQTYTGTATPMTLIADSMTTGTGISISADALSSGSGIAIDSTSTALAGKLLNLTASGAANGTTRYGVYSSLTGAGTTSTNVAGYFNAQNGTSANYGLIVENGNVGIGTATPTDKLTIDGGNLTYAVTAGNFAIKRATAATTGVNQFFLDGNLKDAGSMTDVGGGASITLNAHATTADLGYDGALTLTAYGFGSGTDANTVRFYNRGGVDTITERMRINSNGNVGIGVTNPVYKLDVKGASAGTVTLGNFGTGTQTGADGTFGAATNSYGLISEPDFTITGAATTMNGLYVATNVNAATAQTLASHYGVYVSAPTKSGSASVTNAYGLYVNTPTSGATNYNAIFAGAGYVGIGTTAPAYALDVTGDIRLTGNVWAPASDSTQGYWKLTGSNLYPTSTSYNVGIGTTNPTEALVVKAAAATVQLLSTTTNNGYFHVANSGGDRYFGVETSSGGSLITGSAAYSTIVGGTGAYPLHLATNSAIAMTILSGGNVGIGTTAPGSPLHVKSIGTAETDGITLGNNASGGAVGGQGRLKLWYDGASTGRIDVKTGGTAQASMILALMPVGGLVGIGTIAPSYTLHLMSDTESDVAIETNNNANFAGLRFLRSRGTNAAKTTVADGDIIGYDLITFPYVTTSGYINTAAIQTKINGTVTATAAPTDILFLAGSTTAPEVMRITSGGNVGIGTTGPGALLTLYKDATANATALEFNSYITTAGDDMGKLKFSYHTAAGGAGYVSELASIAGIYGPNSEASGNLVFNTKNAGTLGERMRIDKTGNVGIGTTNPLSNLQVGAGTPGSATGAGDVYIASDLEVDATSYMDGPLVIGTSGLSSTGNLTVSKATGYNSFASNVGIGLTNPAYLLQLNADSAAKPTTNTWTVPSDKRIKKNISDFSDGLSTVMKLKPRTYQYNGLGGPGYTDSDTHIGFIAQEVEPIAPYMIETRRGTIGGLEVSDFKTYQGHALPFILVNAIQEQQKEIEELKSQVKALKGEK